MPRNLFTWYCIAGKFGRKLSLEAWQCTFATTKLKSTNIPYSHIYIWWSLTEPPNLIFLQWQFRTQLSNLIPYSRKISQMVDLYNFTGLIFVDECTHAHYALYSWAYFVSRGSSTKIGPLENFLMYGISSYMVIWVKVIIAIICTSFYSCHVKYLHVVLTLSTAFLLLPLIVLYLH